METAIGIAMVALNVFHEVRSQQALNGINAQHRDGSFRVEDEPRRPARRNCGPPWFGPERDRPERTAGPTGDR